MEADGAELCLSHSTLSPRRSRISNFAVRAIENLRYQEKWIAMKRGGSPRTRIISFLVSLITIATFQPANAANLFTSLNSSCSSYGLNATWKGMQPFSIPAATTITAINLKTLSAQDPSKVVIRIYADNASTPSNTLLGSFTWISTSSDVGRYTGNVTLSSAGKYWIYLSASAQV